MKKSSCCGKKLVRRTFGRKGYYCSGCGYCCDEKTKENLILDMK